MTTYLLTRWRNRIFATTLEMALVEEATLKFIKQSIPACESSSAKNALKSPKPFMNWKLHVIVHSAIKQFKCDHCENDFRHKSNIKRHVISVYERTRSHTCYICAKAFFTGAKLTIHIRIHKGGKFHLCKVCNKAFTHRSSLYGHSFFHQEKLPEDLAPCRPSVVVCLI